LQAEAIADTPVVIVHGPRQCGKTTLATRVGKRLGFEYVNLDDDAARRAAQDDPAGFVARLPERTIIDEVQRAPELFLPLKVEVDRRRVPGRFLLTGSANVLLLPRVADSLAGRMGSIWLHPMAQCEIERREPRFLRALMQGDFRIRSSPRLGEELASRIASGGFPAALARSTTARRRQWYVDYVDAMVQRDLRDLSRISSLRSIPKLLKLAASQTARLINVSDLAAPFQVSRPTIRDYVILLERIFVVDELQP
jgi:predicted AAA+ superfamily ATPase